MYIVMESNSTKYAFEANSEALFTEVYMLLDLAGQSVLDDSDLASPDTGKTPTMHDTPGTVLSTAVDGGRGALCIDSMPSQVLHIIPPNAVLGTAPGDRVEEYTSNTGLWTVDPSTSKL